MKNTMIKVLSFVIALTMIVATLGTVTVFAADECKHTKGDLVEVIKPTCVEPGYSTYKCGTCGDEWVPADTITAKGEQHHEYVHADAVAASCLTNAISAGDRCKYCYKTKTDKDCVETLNTQTLHEFQGAIVPGSCTEDTTFVYTCKKCGFTAEELKKLEGKRHEGVLVKDAFLDNGPKGDGVDAQKYDDFKVSTLAKATGHKYGAYVITKAPNHDNNCGDGEAVGTCTVCGDIDTRPIKAEHKWAPLNDKGYSCSPYVQGSEACSICDTPNPDKFELKKAEDVAHNDKKHACTGVIDPTDSDYKEYGLDLNFLKSQFGLAVGDKLMEPATCTENGYQIVVCECGVVHKVILKKAEHKYEDTWTVSDPEKMSCTDDYKRVKKCTNKDCDAELVEILAKATNTAHTLESTVLAPTCTEYGKTTTVCKGKYTVKGVEYECHMEPKVSDWKNPIGHKYESDPIYDADSKLPCTDKNAWVKQCVNGDCDATTPFANEGAKHNFVTTNIPANCLSGAKYTIQCSVCKYYMNDEASKTVVASKFVFDVKDSKKDPNTHNYEFVEYEVAPTCDKAGVEIVQCTNSECKNHETYVSSRACPALGHKDSDGKDIASVGYGYVYKNDKNKDVAVILYKEGEDEVKLAPTCQTVGYESKAKVCTACDKYIESGKTATVLEKDKDNHPADSLGDPILTIGATCKTPKYYKYNSECCGLVTVYVGEPSEEHSWTDKGTDKAVEPTCTTKGFHAYEYCEWCKIIKPASVVVGDAENCFDTCTDASHSIAVAANDPFVAAYGHDPKEVKEVPALSCQFAEGVEGVTKATGVYAHEECENDGCQYKRFNGVWYNLADTKDGGDADKFEALVTIPAHTKDEYREFHKGVASTCTEDGENEGWFCSVCDKAKIVDAKDGHVWSTNEDKFIYSNYDKATGKPIDCKKASLIMVPCTKCDATKDEYIVAKSAHTLGAEQTHTPTYTCQEDTYKYKQCTGCAYQEITKVVATASGCYTTKGVVGGTKYPISYACQDITEFIDQKCNVCGTIVTYDKIQHNIVNDGKGAWQAPTCTADGYVIKYCVDCGLTGSTEDPTFFKVQRLTVKPNDPAYKAVYGNYTVSRDDNYNHYNDGKHVFDSKEATATEEGFIKYICADCNQEVTDVIEKLEATVKENFKVKEKVAAGEEFTVTYALSDAVTTVKTSVIQIAFDTSLLTIKSVKAVSALGDLTVSFAKTATGANIALVVESTEGATEIKTTVEGTDLFEITFVANKLAAGETMIGTAKVEVIGMGDINKTGDLSLKDAEAIYAIIDNGTNDAAADVDNNGLVDVDDISALAKFVVSNRTVADYFEMVGELDKLEAEVFALLESGKINDINHDRVTNIADAYELILGVQVYYLDRDYSVLGNVVTMAEFVANINAYGFFI